MRTSSCSQHDRKHVVIYPLALVPGKPNPSTFPFTSISVTLTPSPSSSSSTSSPQTLTLDGAPLAEALQYGPTAGIPGLVRWLTNLQEEVHHRKRGGTAENAEWAVSVGSGSQDLMTKVGELLVYLVAGLGGLPLACSRGLPVLSSHVLHNFSWCIAWPTDPLTFSYARLLHTIHFFFPALTRPTTLARKTTGVPMSDKPRRRNLIGDPCLFVRSVLHYIHFIHARHED